jgi:hypothetical protein
MTTKSSMTRRGVKGEHMMSSSSSMLNRYLYKFKFYYIQLFTFNRKLILCVLVFLLFIYFYQLQSQTYSENILPELKEQNPYDYIMGKYADLKARNLQQAQNFNKDDIIRIDPADGDSSIIIDALVNNDDNKEGDSYRLLDSYSLVTEFINGIFFYNFNEPIESWWPFECVRTKMKHSINTQVCIHDPKYDKHISAQLRENGLWEPTNVRSFIRQLNEVPEANVMDIGANIGLYSLISAKLNVKLVFGLLNKSIL